MCDKCISHLMGLSKKKIKRNRREVTRTTERRRMMKIFPSDPLIITLTFNRLRAYISCVRIFSYWLTRSHSTVRNFTWVKITTQSYCSRIATSSGAVKSKIMQKRELTWLKKIIYWLSLQYHEAVGYGKIFLFRVIWFGGLWLCLQLQPLYKLPRLAQSVGIYVQNVITFRILGCIFRCIFKQTIWEWLLRMLI